MTFNRCLSHRIDRLHNALSAKGEPKLIVDISGKMPYTDDYERYAAKHPSQLSAAFCSLQSNTIFVHRQMVSRSSTRETVDERTAWPQPRYHLSVFCVKGALQMRPSIEATTKSLAVPFDYFHPSTMDAYQYVPQSVRGF